MVYDTLAACFAISAFGINKVHVLNVFLQPKEVYLPRLASFLQQHIPRIGGRNITTARSRLARADRDCTRQAEHPPSSRPHGLHPPSSRPHGL